MTEKDHKHLEKLNASGAAEPAVVAVEAFLRELEFSVQEDGSINAETTAGQWWLRVSFLTNGTAVILYSTDAEIAAPLVLPHAAAEAHAVSDEHVETGDKIDAEPLEESVAPSPAVAVERARAGLE